MKNIKLKSYCLFLITIAASLASCNNDDDNKSMPIIEKGTGVTIKNTFQGGVGPAFTDGAEVPIEAFFPDADPALLSSSGTVEDGVEFPAFLLGLYDVDITRNSIDFKLVAEEGDPTYGDFFRTIEAGTFDRYYLTFDKAHNVKSFSSSDASVNLRIDSDNVLVVQIGEGFVFQPGASFSITLSEDLPTTPQILNGESIAIRNTFQGIEITDGVEEKIEDLFGAPAGSLEATATVIEGVEFPAYLLGLYDIDVDENSIEYTLVAQADDPNYGSLFRTIEAGSFDRYYITFGLEHNVESFTSSDTAVNLRVDSDTILVVEIGEGFVFEPGASFTITLN
ncbi:hypothetical protein [Maribacter sp. 1_MG-2023]|uniref:hypothetical protein n=1 Tax=Maribacter sp. 1_MG-2023 TaxID=3062677 RepID=UPI0026E44817|nr:hypothetical protein [Maribacter sp. 1_MG-2023]MDO6473283.1 hypothetical protein [Maribacter sp. 1_MG-2023]